MYKMIVIEVLGVFLFVTSVITSSADEETKKDVVLPFPLQHLFNVSKTSSAATPTGARSIANGEIAAVSEASPVQQIIAEGGLIQATPLAKSLMPSESSERTAVVAENVTLPHENLAASTDDKTLVEHRTDVTHKPKIVPRKEAPSLTDNDRGESDLDKNLSNVGNWNTSMTAAGLPVNVSSTASTINTEPNVQINTSERKSSTLDSRIVKASNDTSDIIIAPEIGTTKSTTMSTTTKAHAKKPTLLNGGTDEDEPIRATPTKILPLGMPRKIDYIVPVVITIMVVPLLGVATFVLYRRGRDCWDKRHYRRMDFLIDGMYND